MSLIKKDANEALKALYKQKKDLSAEKDKAISNAYRRISSVEKLESGRDKAKEIAGMLGASVEKSFGQWRKRYWVGVAGGTAFMACLGVGAYSALMMGDIPLMLAACGLNWWPGKGVYKELMVWPTVEHQFSKQFDFLKMKVEALPDGPEKELFEEFNRAVKGIYMLENAAAISKKCVEGKAKSKEQARGRSLLDKAVAELNLNDENAAKLRDSFGKAAFPVPGSFLPVVDRAFEVLNRAVEAYAVINLKNALLPPAPE